MENITVYRDSDRYAGWPANYGIWNWKDEIVVGFTVGYPDPKGGFHTRDKSKPFISKQARSMDGGQTWKVQTTPCNVPGDRGLSADEHVNEELAVGEVLDEESLPVGSPEEVAFEDSNFALMCARSGLKAGARSWFYISNDRCRSWRGPYMLPMFGLKGVAARTDYLVLGQKRCLLFLTAAKSDGEEGRVFCAHTVDGGQTFEFLSWIGSEPEGFSIMPASVLLPSGRILVAVRCRGGSNRSQNWIDLYASDDQGISWDYLNRPVSSTGRGGNPPTLNRLQDGRLCITYGFRNPPFGIRAKLSSDNGKTWDEEVILRDDAGNHDLGYPRTVERPDGRLVTVYYYNDFPERERYIAATVWKP